MAVRIDQLPQPGRDYYAKLMKKHGKNGPDKCTEIKLTHLGYHAEKAEWWSGKGKTKRDLFGFLDWLCIEHGTGNLLGIQATHRSHLPNRLTKILTHPNYAVVKGSPILVEVWGWDDAGNLYRVAA